MISLLILMELRNYIIPQGLMLGSNNTISDFILKNLIHVTIGNLIAGVLLVGLTSGLMYHKINTTKIKNNLEMVNS